MFSVYDWWWCGDDVDGDGVVFALGYGIKIINQSNKKKTMV